MVRKVKNLFHLFQSLAANIFYGFPSRNLTIIGITGTDGKTTTAHLVHHILKSAGFKAGLVSTVSAPGLHTTTPDPWVLQKLLRKMVNSGQNNVVLEATSHGLDQHRLWGIRFKIGVVTNVTHEHLDYHLTYDRYLRAKGKLFKNVKTAILNKDDRSFNSLKLLLSKDTRLVTYGIRQEADFTPTIFKFSTSLPGEYNQYNCLAAIATASVLGIEKSVIRKSVASFGGVIGRMEEINEGQNFKVIVDFAHTPNALENVLKTLHSQLAKKTGKLIVVFGCAGLRDVKKRPMMGRIASRLADVAVLTAEDPRTENVDEIIDQIVRGFRRNLWIEGKNYFCVSERGEAIKLAIGTLARRGDIVVICGKGHEKSMCFGTTEYAWSDQDQVRKILHNAQKK